MAAPIAIGAAWSRDTPWHYPVSSGAKPVPTGAAHPGRPGSTGGPHVGSVGTQHTGHVVARRVGRTVGPHAETVDARRAGIVDARRAKDVDARRAATAAAAALRPAERREADATDRIEALAARRAALAAKAAKLNASIAALTPLMRSLEAAPHGGLSASPVPPAEATRDLVVLRGLAAGLAAEQARLRAARLALDATGQRIAAEQTTLGTEHRHAAARADAIEGAVARAGSGPRSRQAAALRDAAAAAARSASLHDAIETLRRALGATPPRADGTPHERPDAPRPEHAGGTPTERAGGTPPERAGGAPPEHAGGPPPERAGGAPPERAGGAIPRRAGGAIPRRARGTTFRHAAGAPPRPPGAPAAAGADAEPDSDGGTGAAAAAVAGPAPARLARPVAGPVLQHYGAPGDTGPAKGVTFAPPPGALVSAPCGGRVDFAGPFRSYGRMIILDCGGDARVVLAGLDHLDAQAGTPVRRGEPSAACRTSPRTPPPDGQPCSSSCDAATARRIRWRPLPGAEPKRHAHIGRHRAPHR